MQGALHHLVKGYDHVVTEIVKPKFIVCPVGNIGSISRLTGRVIHFVGNETDRKSQETVNSAHILTVTASQVIIDRHDMDAFSFKGI